MPSTGWRGEGRGLVVQIKYGMSQRKHMNEN